MVRRLRQSGYKLNFMKKKTLSKSEKLLFAAPLLLMLLPIISYVSYLSSQDTLDKKIQNTAEPNSTDCGHNPAWQSGVAISDSFMACAVSATKAGKPFKLKSDPVPNGHMAYGYVRTSDGKLTSIHYTWRKRFGIKDWELIEVYRGDCQIRVKNGREEIWMVNPKKIESRMREWKFGWRTRSISPKP